MSERSFAHCSSVIWCGACVCFWRMACGAWRYVSLLETLSYTSTRFIRRYLLWRGRRSYVHSISFGVLNFWWMSKMWCMLCSTETHCSSRLCWNDERVRSIIDFCSFLRMSNCFEFFFFFDRQLVVKRLSVIMQQYQRQFCVRTRFR